MRITQRIGSKLMKKMTKLLLFLGLTFLLTTLFFCRSDPYQVVSVTSNELEKVIEEKDQSIIYFKKASCPDCQKLDKQLKKRRWKLSFNKTSIIYSLDLDSLNDEEMKQKIITTYNIKTVPKLIVNE